MPLSLLFLFLAAFLLPMSLTKPVRQGLQSPIEDPKDTPTRNLHGRFLQITDIHPDPFYKTHASTEEEDACHRGTGFAGTYGAETSGCDTPFILVNATFKWIKENLRDQIDFVVWTGDSSRHDNDEAIPRTQEEVLSSNRWVVSKFLEVFSKTDDPEDLEIPIIPTFGNNDILPHNIMFSGPNKWLHTYTDIWSKFIPEEQRHGFERGGWFYVEVIPDKLAVFSLNTLYFFGNNAAVDGCAIRSEPGYEHLEWLRVQLQFMRERGMKAILMGHVPPARTASKTSWDETCWQKYTLWLQNYRDIIIGGLYGHMNIDHFMLHDTREVDLLYSGGDVTIRSIMDEELTIESANDYLLDLRDNWSNLPNPKPAFQDAETKQGKFEKLQALKNIGGPWGERYHVSLVSPSIVPEFLPTLRVIEYNISGLDLAATWARARSEENYADWVHEYEHTVSHDELTQKNQKKKTPTKKPQTPQTPDLIIPPPPTRGSPPGPAYSPQSLTLLGYTQYFANLTYINNDVPAAEDDVEANKWSPGKFRGRYPKQEPHPKPFQYQVEYDTFTDSVYKLKDMTVQSYLELAHRIGRKHPKKSDRLDSSMEHDEFYDEDEGDEKDNQIDASKRKKMLMKKMKHHKRHEKNKTWLQFIERAFVGTLADEDLDAFRDPGLKGDEPFVDLHDDEL